MVRAPGHQLMMVIRQTLTRPFCSTIPSLPFTCASEILLSAAAAMGETYGLGTRFCSPDSAGPLSELCHVDELVV